MLGRTLDTFDSVVAIVEDCGIHLTREINHIAITSATDVNCIVVGNIVETKVATIDKHSAIVHDVNQAIAIDIRDIDRGIAASVAPVSTSAKYRGGSLPTIVVSAGLGVLETADVIDCDRCSKLVLARNLRTAFHIARDTLVKFVGIAVAVDIHQLQETFGVVLAVRIVATRRNRFQPRYIVGTHIQTAIDIPSERARAAEITTLVENAIKIVKHLKTFVTFISHSHTIGKKTTRFETVIIKRVENVDKSVLVVRLDFATFISRHIANGVTLTRCNVLLVAGAVIVALIDFA